MFLSALLGFIPSPDNILSELKELKDFLEGVSELKLELIKVERSGLKVNQLKVEIKETKNHRSAETLKSALNRFLEKKQISDLAKQYVNNVLNSLINAEAEVHGTLIEKVHLHELSSVDTLIDIVGVTKVLDILGGFQADFKIICSKLPLGGGTIKTAHGTLPVPAPATMKILEKSNLIIYNGPIESELVTPTGAALLVNLVSSIKISEMNLKKIVYSTGQKEFKEFPNILNIYYGESEEIDVIENDLLKYIEPITVLETDVDDISGEILGNFLRNMESMNILDIQIIPSITKKNRPGHIIKVLCRPEYRFELIEKIMEELGTLGVRFDTVNRVCIERTIEKRDIEIDGNVYDIGYKISYIESKSGKKIINIKPEYEDLNKISKIAGIPVLKIQAFAQAQIPQIYKECEKLKKEKNKIY